jgi:hypothetical protein
MSRVFIRFSSCAIVLFCAVSASAADRFVAPSGDDSASGTKASPYRTVQAALDRAEPGDAIHLAPGVYRERVAFRRGGASGALVVLQGEPGAILDASDPVSLKWTPAADVAEGAWQAPIDQRVITVTAGNKIVTILNQRRVDPEHVQKTLEKGPDPDARGIRPENVLDENWTWPRLFERGVGKTGWTGVKALAMYDEEESRLLLRFEGDLDPRDMAITVAPREPAILIEGCDHCVVRGLEIRNGWEGVRIENSAECIVETCTIGPIDFGVFLAEGAKDCVIRHNEITMAPYSGASPYLEGSSDNWLAHKVGGFWDRIGIDMRHTAGGHEVHDNWIHDHWGGIQDIGKVGENRALNVHHNRISVISDDGLEPNGAEENCRWHDNIVEGCICGFRIKNVRRGPLFAYRNIFFDNKEDYRNFHADYPAEVYVYHNTSTSRSAVTNNKVQGDGTPNYYFFNNLFWCERWWSGHDVEPNWHGCGNVFVRRGDSRRWKTTRQLAAELGIDQNSTWIEDEEPGFVDFDRGDVRLTENSPARGAGLPPQKIVDRPFPGCEPGYYNGKRPDAGALQYGEPMPSVPREALGSTRE